MVVMGHSLLQGISAHVGDQGLETHLGASAMWSGSRSGHDGDEGSVDGSDGDGGDKGIQYYPVILLHSIVSQYCILLLKFIIKYSYLYIVFYTLLPIP